FARPYHRLTRSSSFFGKMEILDNVASFDGPRRLTGLAGLESLAGSPPPGLEQLEPVVHQDQETHLDSRSLQAETDELPQAPMLFQVGELPLDRLLPQLV